MRIRRRRARRMDDTTDDLRAVACIPLVLIPWSGAAEKQIAEYAKIVLALFAECANYDASHKHFTPQTP